MTSQQVFIGYICERVNFLKWTGDLMVKVPTWSMGDHGFESPLLHMFSLWSHIHRMNEIRNELTLLTHDSLIYDESLHI